MTPATTQDYISLGQEHAVTFGKTQLTLNPVYWLKANHYPVQRGW